MDAIFDGKLRPEPTVKSFIRSTEQIGPRARRLTLLRAVTVYIALVRQQTPRSVLPAQVSYPDLEPDEARILSDLERRYQDAFWSYLSWGSATAWIIMPLMKVSFRFVDPEADLATEWESPAGDAVIGDQNVGAAPAANYDALPDDQYVAMTLIMKHVFRYRAAAA
jgi:hypothetical protein